MNATVTAEACHAHARAHPWHPLAADEVVQLLDTNLEAGLTSAEAARRQEKCGPNRLSALRHSSALKRFVLQFAQPLMYSLVVAASITVLISISLGHWVSESWLLLFAFVGVDLIQSAITGFCPAENALRKFGIGKDSGLCSR